jgi:hypothetical protein
MSKNLALQTQVTLPITLAMQMPLCLYIILIIYRDPYIPAYDTGCIDASVVVHNTGYRHFFACI